MPGIGYRVPPEEFLDELDAFDPRWQKHYRTMPDAAKAAGLFLEYQEFCKSPQGESRTRLFLDAVPDYAGYAIAALAAQERLTADMARGRVPTTGDYEMYALEAPNDDMELE
jgi:hypothetical protein